MSTTLDDRGGIAIVHLMKTGGTSIGRAIRPQFEPDECYPRAGDKAAANDQKVNADVLLALPPDERAALRFVSVHQPAWVLGDAVPHLPTATMLRHPVDRCISHLRQLVNHPWTDHTLEELWEIPSIRRRLANYQTQVFASSRSIHENRPRMTKGLDELSDDEQAALQLEVLAARGTGINQVLDVDDESFAAAVERLETIDVVGTLDDLRGFGVRLARRSGIALPAIGHENRAADNSVAGAALRARIEEDNRFDLALYRHAAVLA